MVEKKGSKVYFNTKRVGNLRKVPVNVIGVDTEDATVCSTKKSKLWMQRKIISKIKYRRSNQYT